MTPTDNREPLSGEMNKYDNLVGELSNHSSIFGEIDGRDGLQGELNAGSSSSRDYNVLINKPSINGIELIGDKTSEELNITGDKNFYYVHSGVASDTWTIVHNLNKYPSVSIIDSSGTEVIGEVAYDSVNQVTVTFKGAFKGKATLN